MDLFWWTFWLNSFSFILGKTQECFESNPGRRFISSRYLASLSSYGLGDHYLMALGTFSEHRFLDLFPKEQISVMKVKVTQSCQTLCDPMDYTVHGIVQARVREWVAFPFSRTSSQPRDQTQVFYNAGRFFTSRATRESQEYWSG